MPKIIDLTGNIYGRLTVLELSHKDDHRNYYWNCICECGNQKAVLGNSLKSGETKSCGCLKTSRWNNPKLKHGHAKGGKRSPTYYSWTSMRSRCNYPGDKFFDQYGARGISVCDRWSDSFQNFLDDMGERPAGMTLDRKDNDGNYCPENCQWSDQRSQSQNQSTTNLLTYKGKTLCLSEWARKYNLNQTTLRHRIKSGWDIKTALEMHPNRNNRT